MDHNDLGHILFVCTGNTCRSPMAAALFRHALAAEPEPLKSLEVKSAGIAAMDGAPASPNAIEAVRKVGLRLDTHRATSLTRDLVDDALAIYCMTESHRQVIQMRFDPPPKHLYLMREFVARDPADADIPDPVGQAIAAYEAARDAMVEAIPSLIEHVRRLVAEAASGD
ncbi:MAG: low molecular weight protein arginine phosphatase [Verrucomicrobia bacterium]|nr:MAG: low molecular weight protein arginine phosphatase [Verrucomicrobiota bacterium]